MVIRPFLATLLCASALPGQKVKTKVYTQPSSCQSTYRLDRGRVLTSSGLIEDPTVNSIMQQAVSTQMKELKISEAAKDPGLIVRFMGGTSQGVQIDDLSMGDVAMWNIGGPVGVSSRAYKKSTLVIGVLDAKANQTLWAATCTDNFGDPSHLQERIQKSVSKAFSKFPKKIACN
jgi:Domain of unknown function (DUF4136)